MVQRGFATDVQLIVFDVDGVLTDGGINVGSAGDEIKRFHVLDGLGIRLLRFHGVEVGILSGRASPALSHRATEIGIDLVEQGVREKRPRLEAILAERGLSAKALCYVGDDLIDIPCMRLAGFPVAVANAKPEIKKFAAYVTRANSRDGAAREVAEIVLKARKRWEAVLERYAT